jgi:hypothetical protein
VTSKRFEETRIGWMETNKLECGQYHCPECGLFFHYVNDTDDRMPPKFCSECGRKNANAS